MADPRERLKLVRDGLLTLHKKLLDSERAAYERDYQRIDSAGQFLQLLLNEPFFAWLHDLSRFIVTIDETLDMEELPEGASEKLITTARAMLVPSETGDGFARRYDEAMQRDPAAVLAHGEMMKVFAQAGS